MIMQSYNMVLIVNHINKDIEKDVETRFDT